MKFFRSVVFYWSMDCRRPRCVFHWGLVESWPAWHLDWHGVGLRRHNGDLVVRFVDGKLGRGSNQGGHAKQGKRGKGQGNHKTPRNALKAS
ncbi:hypothetical protein Ae201684_002007 [Aphanomyces euteiches]|uniref:Uncharacterized protein n=1 Tax=Aphanomyces euteiches TaxID=100861 RepID=A0A6G0XRY6_9STRA|nr:hypothetical protein Ae201684_002007 [Aphanomyces euteiches]